MANLTRTRQAVLIEPLRPERFTVSKREGGACLEVSFDYTQQRENNASYHPQVRTFNATSLYILSICEVCGSYQCPYCPFYSASAMFAPSLAFVAASFFVSFLLTREQLRTFQIV